jgi:hypothetical protein
MIYDIKIILKNICFIADCGDILVQPEFYCDLFSNIPIDETSKPKFNDKNEVVNLSTFIGIFI